MSKIICAKCGNNRRFTVVVSTVFDIYVNGDGETLNKESLTDAFTGILRVECSLCNAELDVGYDLKTQRAYLLTEKYIPTPMIHAK